MLDETARRAVEQGDADRLLAIVDGLCSSREWASLWQLEEHCRAAVDRGKQLWGVAEHVLYRIALEAPPREAARAVNRGPTRHTLGPLTEVVASSHTWKELAPHLEAEPARTVVAHERVVRGEPVGPGEVDPTVLELPTHLAPWEGPYPEVTYHRDRVEAPPPPFPDLSTIPPGRRRDPIRDARLRDAFYDLVSVWIDRSNGRFDFSGVEGDLADSLTTLGVPRAAAGAVSPAGAVAHMAWAAASGGAYAMRRGYAFGRFAAWWAVSVLGGLDWPPDPGMLGRILAGWRWWVWTDGSTSGWQLRLAVDTGDVTWVVSASDSV